MSKAKHSYNVDSYFLDLDQDIWVLRLICQEPVIDDSSPNFKSLFKVLWPFFYWIQTLVDAEAFEDCL